MLKPMRMLSGLLLFSCLAWAQPALRQFSDDLVKLTERLHPTIVLIRSEGFEPVGKEVPLAVRQTGTGSGVIISEDGYIVTNAHVVGKSTTVDVLLAPPLLARSAPEHHRLLEGKVLGRDTEADIAVVKVEASGLAFLQWGDSERLHQGQVVVALGNPMGLENTATMGVVSSTQRQIRPDDRMVYIQTDAAINPGNSGGALVDLEGKLIGINTMILTQSGGSEGIGFSVPARIAGPVAEQLRKDGKVTRGDIGVTTQTLTYGLSTGLGIPQETGVIVSDVEPKSPAAIEGIQPGDIILSVDGRPMETARQFHVLIYRKPVAQLVKIEALRGAEKKLFQPVVVDRAEKSPNLAKLSVGPDSLIRRLRALAVPLDDDIMKDLPELRYRYGLLVAGLVPGVYLQQDGIQPGDIIHSINNKPIATLQDARGLIDALPARARVALLLEREGKTKFVEYQLE